MATSFLLLIGIIAMRPGLTSTEEYPCDCENIRSRLSALELVAREDNSVTDETRSRLNQIERTVLEFQQLADDISARLGGAERVGQENYRMTDYIWTRLSQLERTVQEDHYVSSDLSTRLRELERAVREDTRVTDIWTRLSELEGTVQEDGRTTDGIMARLNALDITVQENTHATENIRTSLSQFQSAPQQVDQGTGNLENRLLGLELDVQEERRVTNGIAASLSELDRAVQENSNVTVNIASRLVELDRHVNENRDQMRNMHPEIGCKPGYSYHDDVACLMLNDGVQYMSRGAAKDICESSGGHLVIADSAAVKDSLRDIIYTQLVSLGRSGWIIIWTDLYYVNTYPGGWRWNTTGEVIRWSDWAPSEPQSGEYCMAIVCEGVDCSTQWKWYSYRCGYINAQALVVCQHSPYL